MNHRGKAFILTLSALLFSFSLDTSTRQLTNDELKEDASALRKALEKYHPGLYWYTSKEEFDKTWDNLHLQLGEPMSDAQFLKLLLPVVAKVKCAHTLFSPSEEILTRGNRFPLDLKFINGKGYLMPDSVNQYQIPNGSELLSINGKSLAEIVEMLLPGLQAQGGNVGWKYVILENDFQNYYYYSIDQSEDFEIEYQDHATGQKKAARVAGSTEDVRRRHWKNWYPKETGAPLTLKYLADPQAAMITIKSFSRGRYKQYHQDFDKLIDQYFEEINTRGVQNLIIDLRGNEGGNNPEKVYSWIARENDRFADESGSLVPRTRHPFQGKVIVLANERSISAQESFVSIFKNNNRGLTIGRPTAGSYDGLCGGNKRKVVLSNSHFEIQIPLHAERWTPADSNRYRKGEGFPPDIKPEENIDDVLSGKDVALEVALDKIWESIR